ncbi:MAG: Phospholipase/Carboxylesterase [Lentisphaerae bacterium ADurb.Bin242]|nr:MAG: Phospholipase/Carboxylesterase [Lentisphaerae bacterium ADurb.Bin242]
MGGYGAWDIVSRMPETFAAVFPICGGADVRQAPKLKNIAVYTLHGDQDTAVPVFRSRDMVKALRDCGNTRVVYRELPGVGHNAWDAAFADDQALEWLFSQTK